MRRGVDLERNIYLVSAQVAWANFWPCLTAVLLLVASDIGGGFLYAPLAFAVLRALILMIAGYAAYRMLLSGGAVRGWRAAATPEGRVPWRYAGVMLIILGPILLLGVVWTGSDNGGAATPNGLAAMGLGIVMVMIYASLYVLIGTALPEVAELGVASLADAVARGRAHYREIARAMVTGPWLFRVASMLALIVANMAGVQTDLFSVDARAFHALGVLPTVLFRTSHVFAEVMTAVVLARAYRRYPLLPEDAVPA